MHCCLSFMQHWQKLSPHGPDAPMERWDHAATCFTSQSLGIKNTLLLILGGYINTGCWLCDVQDVKWMRVSWVFEKILAQWWHYNKMKSRGHRKYTSLTTYH